MCGDVENMLRETVKLFQDKKEAAEAVPALAMQKTVLTNSEILLRKIISFVLVESIGSLRNHDSYGDENVTSNS